MRRGFLPSAFAIAVALVACGGSSATDLFGSSGGADSGTGGPGSGADGAVSTDGSTGGNVDGGASGNDAGNGGNDASMGGTCPAPAGIPAGDGGLTCNGVALQGSPMTTNCHQGPPPTAKGGTIKDGVYVLDQLDFYGDPNSCPKEQERIVWDICGTAWSSVQDFGNGAVYYNVTASPSAVPGQITLDLKCPSLTTVQDRYDAASDSLTLYISINGGTRLDRFKRQ